MNLAPVRQLSYVIAFIPTSFVVTCKPIPGGEEEEEVSGIMSHEIMYQALPSWVKCL